MTTRLAPPEVDSNVAVSLQQKSGYPFSADCRFSGSRKCAISGGRSPGSDPQGYFPCTGSNLEIGADLIPDFWHFWPLGIKDLQGQNEGVRCPTISKDQVLEILPDATVLPPAEQGDVT
jgi:hypothetical protein